MTWIFDMPQSKYRVQPHITASAVKLFAQSPRKFQLKYVLKDPRFKEEYKPGYKTGTLVHMSLLEPDEYLKRVHVCDSSPRSASYQEFIQERVFGVQLDWDMNGKGRYFDADFTDHYIVTTEEKAQIDAMRDSCLNHKHFMKYFVDAHTEVSGICVDPATQQPLACRPDIIGKKAGLGGYIVDVKTLESLSQEAIQYHIYSYGYHLQQTHYLHVANQIEPNIYKNFFFMFVEKAYPHECALVQLDLDPTENHLLNCRYFKLLAEIKTAALTQEYGTLSRDIVKVIMPYWQKRSLEP